MVRIDHGGGSLPDLPPFRTADDQIEVLKWDPASNDLEVDLYVTLGASAEDMPGGEPGHRVEYFVGLWPGMASIASALATLGLFARREQELVDHGHTVPAGGRLWPGTETNAFLLLRQIGQVVPPLELSDGFHIEFLQAIPLFESERRSRALTG